jgi:hypothetical protein
MKREEKCYCTKAQNWLEWVYCNEMFLSCHFFASALNLSFVRFISKWFPPPAHTKIPLFYCHRSTMKFYQMKQQTREHFFSCLFQTMFLQFVTSGCGTNCGVSLVLLVMQSCPNIHWLSKGNFIYFTWKWSLNNLFEFFMMKYS